MFTISCRENLIWYFSYLKKKKFTIHCVNSQEDLQKLLPVEVKQIQNIYCIVHYIHRSSSNNHDFLPKILGSEIIYSFFIYLVQEEINAFLKEETHQIRLLYFLSYLLSKTSFSQIEQYIQDHLKFVFFDCDYDTYRTIANNLDVRFLPSVIAYPLTYMNMQKKKYIILNDYSRSPEQSLLTMLKKLAKYFVRYHLNVIFYAMQNNS